MTIQNVEKPTAHLPASGLLGVDPDLFRASYNRRPFQFEHRLHDHPLLQLDSLVDLANRLPQVQVMHCRGQAPIETDFDEALRHRKHRFTLDEVLSDMEHADAYVLLSHVEMDPLYGKLLQQALDDIRRLSEPVDPGMCEEAAFIFIASPGAVTPYHMDREMNFLCQVRGTKRVQLWNQDDATILPAAAIDQLFARPDLPKPGWKPEYAAKAMTFTLSPGTGVHQPLLAPHAVQNGNELSIAIALTFRSKACVRRIRIHQANYQLRQVGLNPGAFGTSPLLDRIKHQGYNGYLSAMTTARNLRHR
jgi:Cupin-like domain